MRVRRSLAAIIPENLGARPSTIMRERPRPTNTTAKAVTQSLRVNSNLVRLADIYIFSCEGPVWIILLFKQLFICVHFYQLCQAEELL